MSVAFNKLSTLLASGGMDNLIKIWDIDKFECIQTLVGHESYISSLDFHPFEDKLVSGS